MSGDRLTAFLYVLMRDHLPCGVVESLMQNHVEGRGPASFSNPYLASYAAELAERLTRTFEEHGRS